MSPPDRDTTPGLRVHRALASPVRTRLLEVLRGEPDLDAVGLAARLGLHVNTVRTHLGLLEEAELVEARAEERERPGRPRLLYRVTPDEPRATTGTETGTDQGGYRFLASILASYLGATTRDTSVSAERAGRAWGGFIVDKPAPFAELEPAEALDRLAAMLGEFGFAPEVDDTDPEHPSLVLRRCPFLEVAREHQDVVCSIHLGLMRGALDELGVDVQVRDLVPWAQPDACVAHLRVGAGAT
jgi:predicted ArsR family transcriptional regulator